MTFFHWDWGNYTVTGSLGFIWRWNKGRRKCNLGISTRWFSIGIMWKKGPAV